jgi:hypothetical protein
MLKQRDVAPMRESAQECIKACIRCHQICLDTVANYCLERGGRHAHVHHVRAMLDCAEICTTAANFLLRGSPQHGLTCKLCAEVCARCAESCEDMGDDETMAACAKSCRNCQDSCAQMAA